MQNGFIVSAPTWPLWKASIKDLQTFFVVFQLYETERLYEALETDVNSIYVEFADIYEL